MLSSTQQYAQFLKPSLAKKLKALKLDWVYTRAQGNLMYAQTESGERQVLDFLGGYGANLFGHYHPQLTATMQQCLEAQLPLQAQGSIRPQAAALAQTLSERTKQAAQQDADYVVTLTNSGAETVEAALKHALLSYEARKSAFFERFYFLKAQFIQAARPVPKEALPQLAALGYQGPEDLVSVLDYIERLNQKQFQRAPVLLALEGGFHGKTSGAMQLTHNPQYRTPFGKLGLEVCFLDIQTPLDLQTFSMHLIQLDEAHGFKPEHYSNVLACFVEPLQGEGGIQYVNTEYLQQCRQAADHYGFPLVFDEIQSGMGRTGKFYCAEYSAVAGDYYLLAKSLGGGLCKLGALMVRQDLYRQEFGEIHSSTFAEDALSSQVALKALDLLDDALMQNIRERGDELTQGLKRLKEQYPQIIRDVRGLGLMLGIEFCHLRSHPSCVLQLISSQDLLGYVAAGYLLHVHGIRLAPTLSSPNTLRLEPSAEIRSEDCQRLLQALKELCEALSQGHLERLLGYLVRKDYSYGPAVERAPLDWEPEHKELPHVAFAGHFIVPEDMPLWDAGLKAFNAKELSQILEMMYLELGPLRYDRRIVKAKNGKAVQLSFIGICASSQQMHRHLRGNPEPIQEILKHALFEAQNEGATVLGLGGYNSILTGNARSLPPDQLKLTTGNSLTVGMGLRAIQDAAAQQNLALDQSCFAALGANGNIASVYAELMAEKVPRIILIGRPGREPALQNVAERICYDIWKKVQQTPAEELTALARSIYELESLRDLNWQVPWEKLAQNLLESLLQLGEASPLRIATDPEAIAQAELILGASNAPEALIFPELLGPGPKVICDISVPLDTDIRVWKERPDVQVIQGGVVRLPENPDFIIGGIPLEPGLAFACMAETLLMGLSGHPGHYSYGRISKKQVQNILKLADEYGFELGRARLENSY